MCAQRESLEMRVRSRERFGIRVEGREAVNCAVYDDDDDGDDDDLQRYGMRAM